MYRCLIKILPKPMLEFARKYKARLSMCLSRLKFLISGNKVLKEDIVNIPIIINNYNSVYIFFQHVYIPYEQQRTTLHSVCAASLLDSMPQIHQGSSFYDCKNTNSQEHCISDQGRFIQQHNPKGDY